MADVSASEIKQAYEDVRSDKSATNWLLITYESDRSNKLKLAGQGSGGLDELKESLTENDAAFAYARISYSNDKESQREKFIFISWIPEGTKVMRKAKMGVQSGDVKKVLCAYSIDVPAREKDDLNEEHIVVRLRKAGGASYDGV